MRGSNVLRLRARRPLGHHYYFSPRRRYNSSTEPISDTEFLEAWTSVASGGVLVPEMGLAVSGGVDSMALATLYARAEKSLSSLPRCHGIIVDHKVRPESSEEAEWVAEQLRSNCKSPIPGVLRKALLTGISWNEVFHHQAPMAEGFRPG